MTRVTPPVFRSILCPVDFSANSRAALRYAIMLSRLSDAHLHVMHVEDPLLAAAAASRGEARAILASIDDDLRKFVARVMRGTTPAPKTTLLTMAGRPAHEIVRAAQRHGCDLIVMGHRGAGRASRFLFGSTTAGVVRLSSIPVVAVPPLRRGARLPASLRLRRAS